MSRERKLLLCPLSTSTAQPLEWCCYRPSASACWINVCHASLDRRRQRQRSATKTYLVGIRIPSLSSQQGVHQDERNLGFAYPLAVGSFRCKVSKADRFEKVTETCRLILASAWKTPFHTSCGFFTTMWRAKGCILDYQRASILVTNCPIWVKTKSSVQLERKSKGI